MRNIKSWKRITVIMAILMVLSLVPQIASGTDEAEWWNFRNNYENNGVTDRKLPNSDKVSALKWGSKLGSGWSAMPTPPVIVNGHPYVGAGNKILKLDRDTGKVIQTSDPMVGNVGFATNPIVYAEGMLFVQVGNGVIQAMDAETLKPLWSSNPVGGQTVSPIAYKKIDGKGYLYMGTWTGENRDGTFFAVTTEDEDKTRGNEIKNPTWAFIPSTGDPALARKPGSNRGFYWAGAYATEKYVAVGSDDGTPEGDYTANAVLYTLNPKTGDIIDRMDGVKGDIRTTVVYDKGHLYFSTKGGEMYRVPVDQNGKLGKADKIVLEGMTTASPVVYKDKIYIGVCGKGGQFDPDGGHNFSVIKNVPGQPLELEYKLPVPGYPQAGALLTTAYENEDYNKDGKPDGRVYIFFTYNAFPGGLYYTYYEPGLKDIPKAEPLFIPPTTPDNMQEHCISTISADKDGTMYYKNDSGYVMAIDINPAYLEGATVTPNSGEAQWSDKFNTGINNYTIKVKPECTTAKLDLTMPEGATATVNDKPFDKGKGMTVTLNEKGRYEAKVVVRKEGKQREYSFVIERESQVATLKDLQVNGSNAYGFTVFKLIPGFNPDVYQYRTEVLSAKKEFYNVWPSVENPKAKIQVFPSKNVDTSDKKAFLPETGEYKVTQIDEGHARYAIYAKDKSQDSEVKIKVTSESGTYTKEYKLTIARKVDLASIDLEPKTLEMVTGGTATLKPVFNPSNASVKDVTWSSADQKVATVKDGVVTAAGKGETKITVTSADGSKTAQATVKVIDLDAYKAAAKAELDKYKNPGDYREAQRAELTEAITRGKEAIDAAADEAKVKEAVANAKGVMDKIKTEAQLKEEEKAADLAAAKAVDSKIAAIGEVTLDKKVAVAEARAAYEALTEPQKAMVTKLETLKEAEKKLAELEADALQAIKDKAKALLDKYKDPKEYREAEKAQLAKAILDGKNAIDKGTNGAKVEEALTAAKAVIDKIKTDAQLKDEEAAKAVDSKIGAIGEVTLEKKVVVTEARAAYDALTDTQKTMVTKLETLKKAEKKLAELEAGSLQNIKAAAKAELDKYKNPEDYREAQRAELNEAITRGKESIDAAADEAKVKEAVANAKGEIDKIKTDAQLKEEEAAADLAAAKAVDAKIDAIGEVTLEKDGDIKLARKAYESLTEAQKAKVSKLAILEAAEAKVEELKNLEKEEADRKVAKGVNDKIAAIGQPDLSKEEVIKEVRAAYDLLTPAQKSFVTNENVLKEAEEKIAAMLKEPLIKIDYDKSSPVDGAKHLIWEKGKSKSLAIRVLAEFDTFMKVLVDGKELDVSNYKAKEGSIFIEFDKAYLNSLEQGQHNVKVFTKNGYAEGTILVSKEKDVPVVNPVVPTPTPNPGVVVTPGEKSGKEGIMEKGKKMVKTSAETGDPGNGQAVRILGFLALMTCIVAAVNAKTNRRKNR